MPVSRVGAAQMTRKTSSSTEDLRLSAAKEPTNAVDVKTEPGLDGGKLKTEPAATGETKSNGVASVRPNSPDLVVSSRQQPDPHRQMVHFHFYLLKVVSFFRKKSIVCKGSIRL